MAPDSTDYRPVVLLALRETGEASQLTSFLADQGFRVETTRDGEATVNAIQGLPLDAIVVDERLQRLDGLRILDFVRARLPDICLILISDRHDTDLDVALHVLHDLEARYPAKARYEMVEELCADRGAAAGPESVAHVAGDGSDTCERQTARTG